MPVWVLRRWCLLRGYEDRSFLFAPVQRLQQRRLRRHLLCGSQRRTAYAEELRPLHRVWRRDRRVRDGVLLCSRLRERNGRVHRRSVRR